MNLADRIGIGGCEGSEEVVLAHKHVLFKPKTLSFY